MIYKIVNTLHLNGYDFGLAGMIEGGEDFFSKLSDVSYSLRDLFIELPVNNIDWLTDPDALSLVEKNIASVLADRIESHEWEFTDQIQFVKRLHDENRRWAFNAQMGVNGTTEPFPEIKAFLDAYRVSKSVGTLRIAEAVDVFLINHFSKLLAAQFVEKFSDVIKRFHSQRGIASLRVDMCEDKNGRSFSLIRPWYFIVILNIQVTE
ncbi:MAG: hypothetical protein ACRDBQ_18465 [Shewanella sp.]